MILEIENLTKNYGNGKGLNDFSYTFRPGIYGILGPNGAGKSTLMNLLTDNVKREKQGDDFTLAPMIKRENERLDFNMTGKEIIGRIKGMCPWPLANIMINDLEVKVLDAEFVKSNTEKAGRIIFEKKKMGIKAMRVLLI